MIETLHLQATIAEDGTLKLEVPSKLPPGPADVVLVVVPTAGQQGGQLRWRDFYGAGKELWGDEDTQEYVNRLREEWD